MAADASALVEPWPGDPAPEAPIQIVPAPEAPIQIVASITIPWPWPSTEPANRASHDHDPTDRYCHRCGVREGGTAAGWPCGDVIPRSLRFDDGTRAIEIGDCLFHDPEGGVWA